MKKLCNRPRKGMTIIETVIALFLLGFAVIVMTRLTSARITEAEVLNAQFNIQAADAYMYGIYQDFHRCNNFVIVDDPITDDTGTVLRTITKSLSFDLGAEGIHIYSFDYDLGKAYLNGAEVFPCNSFVARGTLQSLYVSVKLENQKIIEFEIYP